MGDITFKFEEGKFNFRVAVLIENEGRILVQNEEKDENYRLPGGRVYIMEDTSKAIKREIKEEIGIDVKTEDLKLVQIAENFFDYLDNGKIKNVHELSYIYNLIIDDSFDITKKESFKELEKEHVTFIWKTKEEILKKDFKLVPDIVKNVIGKRNLNYNIIDDRKYNK